MLDQLNMQGLTKVEQAIERMQKFEPQEGYYMAFSGGKDSVTLKALADMAGVKYDAHYSVTSIDPPELVQFVKTFDDVLLEFPKYKDGGVVTMWNLIPKKYMPPTRLARYCCQYFKEQHGHDRFKMTGVRWFESLRRRQTRSGIEYGNDGTGKRNRYDPDAYTEEEAQAVINTDGERILNPIIDWDDGDIWEFIRRYNVRHCGLYEEGFKRLGCIGCPMAGGKAQMKEFERWPKYQEAYMKAFERMLKNAIEKGHPTTWNSAEEVMAWWIKWNGSGEK